MPRAFLGLPVNSDLAALAHQSQKEITGVRWIVPMNLHVTVIFLGSIDTETLAKIGRSLGDVPCPRIRTHVSRVTFLPNDRRPRIMALELLQTPEITSLVMRARAAVGRTGVGLEGRSFRPHVTVARLKPSAKAHLTTLLEALQSTVAQPFTSTRLNLYESITRPTGAEYRVLQTFDLVDLRES